MKFIEKLVFLLFFFTFLACSTGGSKEPLEDSTGIVKDSIILPAGSVIIWDTVTKRYIIWDTVYKTKRIFTDTVYKIKIIATPIDSPYTVPRPIDSFYTVPRPIDSPYSVPIPIDSPYTVPVPIYINDTIKIPVYKDSCVETPPSTATDTDYGALLAGLSLSETKNKMIQTGMNMVRVPVFWSTGIGYKSVDDYIASGFYVQINFNYKPTGTPVPFPTDTVEIRQQAEYFFNYFKDRKDKIVFVAVENEWDNLTIFDASAYHTNDISYYLTELKIVTEVGHKYGFKIADAGITGNNLQRWTYSKLSGDEARWWISHYFVGQNATNYQPMLTTVSRYIEGIKTIPIDYLNVHWYNKDYSNGGFITAVKLYKNLCQKNIVVNNEFGIRVFSTSINTHLLFEQTVKEMEGTVLYALAYSGINEPQKALKLTDAMLTLLKNE